MPTTFPKLIRFDKPASPDRFGLAETKLGFLLLAWQGDAVAHLTVLPAGREERIHEMFHDLSYPVTMKRDDKKAQHFADTILFPNGEWTGIFPASVIIGFFGTDFQWHAMQELVKVPAGKTISYGELARQAGKPGAARAAGSVCAKNPVPLLVPCHRILASNGLGGYGLQGLSMKRRLLAWETVDSTP